MHQFSALIAEDEPLLAAALQSELARLWPALNIAATVGDGASAVREALALRPDVVFFDIKMPGQSGLDAAVQLADLWVASDPSRPFPALVFVTAYDQFAVRAFEAQALDYVLKPVQTARLKKTVEKIKNHLETKANQAQNAINFDDTLAQLRALTALTLASTQAPTAVGLLQFIQASVGNTVRMVPIDDVLCFEAADKYIRVLTAAHEYLIRTPLKELVARLDAQTFWQVHRGTLVRASCIEVVTRDEAGKVFLQLRSQHPKALKFPVSRLYAHLFKAM